MTGRRVHAYEGAAVRITYDTGRCVHAGECTRGSRLLFDPRRKPWCDPDAVTPDEAVAVVARCPSGALQVAYADGTRPGAPVPEVNTVQTAPNGPLYVHGRLEVDGAEAVGHLALCRCGGSRNKPFCDNTHDEIGFKDSGAVAADPRHDDVEHGEVLRIAPIADGPYVMSGPVVIRAASGRVAFVGHRVALCRCGGSQNKPFCDGTHKTIGFRSAS